MKRSTTQVVAAVAEAAAVAAVAAERWKMNMAAMVVVVWGRSMAAAAFDGGHAATSRHATRGRVGSGTGGREDERAVQREATQQPAGAR